MLDAFMLSALLATWVLVRTPRRTYADYLESLGWKLTRWIRKSGKCQQCGATKRLELHHESYRWHNRHPVLRVLVPNLFDPMTTLCREDHEAVSIRNNRYKELDKQ